MISSYELYCYESSIGNKDDSVMPAVNELMSTVGVQIQLLLQTTTMVLSDISKQVYLVWIFIVSIYNNQKELGED